MLQQRLPFKLATLALLASAACVGTASAADDDSVNYHFNGFGTVGANHSNYKDADYIVFPKPDGSGRTRSWNAYGDSMLGAQLDVNLNPNLSAVLQVISEQTWDTAFTPHVEWANVKYAFSPDFSVRLGRISLPAYLYSETRKVRYTMPFVRTPNLFYVMLPMSSNDGVDASYRFRVGDVTNTTIAMYGRYDFTEYSGDPKGSRVQTRNNVGLTNRTEYGNLLVQVSRYQTNVTMPDIMAGIPSLAPLFDDAHYTFTQLGFNYDPGQWFVQGEVAQDKAPFLGERRGWYMSAGFRIGAFTPYAMYESQRETKKSFRRFNRDMTVPSAGVRWDVAKNVDIKLQYDHNKLGPKSTGTLINFGPKFAPGHPFSVVSVAADFVF